MRRATHIHRAGQWPDGSAVAAVTLAFDDRHRRRIRLSDDAGEPFLLDLPEAVLMADGDGLALADGGYIQVRAADEAVADIAGETPAHTARLAWHIGNRHTPVQVLPNGVLRIRDDHVLVAMAEGLGAKVVRRAAPFSPEPGAYAGSGHGHAHDH
jgi:urease accessory protein